MPLILIERRTPLPVGEAWRRLTAWEHHADRLPLTGIAVETPPPTRVGTRFVARTGIGRLAFDDPMEVVRWEPPLPADSGDATAGNRPGLCRLEKRGSVVEGWAEIEVISDGAGSRAVWREDARVRALPRLFDVPTVLAGRVIFGRAVDGLLGESPSARR